MGKFGWAALVFAATVGAATGVDAQSGDRSNQNVVQIRIPRGQVCFRHTGDGTRFIGNFRRGQHLVATSTGDQLNGDGHADWTTTQARVVEVQWGPRDNQRHEFSGDNQFTAPVDGRYNFTFYPNSMVGGPGVFIVCAF